LISENLVIFHITPVFG
jgi:hypothetical protein